MPLLKGRKPNRRTSPILLDTDGGILAAPLRRAVLNSNLSRIPFKSYHMACLTVEGTCNLQGGGIKDNPDGSNIGLYMACTKMANATDFKYAHATWSAVGRIFGIRYVGPQTFPFDVIIDGEAYEVAPLSPGNMQSSGVWTGSQIEECIAILDTELEDIRHVVEVVLAPDQPGGADRTLLLLGSVGERRYGMDTQIPDVGDTIVGTLTSSQAAVVSSQLPRRLHRLSYVNTHTSPVTVTVIQNGKLRAELVLAAAGSAGSWDEVNFGPQGTSRPTLVTHGANVADKVDWTASVTW